MSERDRECKQLNRERFISLSDLFEDILRKIWLIIILAIIFAVICAGYKYSSDRSKAKATTNSESYEKAQSALTDEEKREVDSVLLLYDEVAAQEEYMENSILMNIDPYHENRVVMQFAVQADVGVMTNALQAVDNYVTGGSLVTDLAENYAEEDSVYLSELISYEEGTVAEEQADMETKEEEGEEVASTTAMFWVQVIHSDQASAERLADEVAQCIASFSEDLTSFFGACEIEFLSQSVTQVYDSSLKNTQNTAVSDQITQQNKIVTQTDSLSEEQVDVLEASLAEGSEAEGTVTDTITEENAVTQDEGKVHISARYVLIGILIGIVIGIILIALIYICRGTLNIAQEMPSEFGVALLGQVHVKRPRSPLVRGWRRLTSRKKALPLETEQQIALTNLKNFCKNHQVDRLLLTGSGADLSENEWLNEVCESLKKEQIAAEIVGGLPTSPNALEELNQYSYIALVETLRKSVYKDVVREMEICTEQQIQVAGAIILSLR